LPHPGSTHIFISMFHAQSLALYKNRPVLVLEARDKIEIRLEDGGSLKVREKDISLLHEGPVKAIPAAAEGGDFETGRRMLASEAGSDPSPLPWAELAELVFGRSGPSEVLACWKEASEGLRFRIENGFPQPLGDEAVAREAEKRARKEGEASERADFIERAKRIKAAHRSGTAETQGFAEADGRYLAEIEALADGRSAKSRVCAELGVSETPEAAQAFLLAAGRWDESVNPHPARSGCPLAAPRAALDAGTGGLERVDLTEMESWAIDNAWSNDPDDAIGWDGKAAWIHVADPASAIAPDSPADEEALARGSTLYLPELVSPMLPDEALERFGLGIVGPLESAGARDGRDLPISPALSFRVEVAEDGSLGAVEVMASTVRVRRASYGEADRAMAEGAAPGLAALAVLAARRKARRVANGAVEIDIPEIRVKVTGSGPSSTIEILSVPHDESSALVREMMLLAGEAAARWAFERGLPFPFYGQEAPSEPGQAALGDALSAQFAKRRLMRAGAWGPSPSAHRGLGLPFYAQATSPLRRYQDLLAHMQIRAALSGAAGLDADEISRRCALAQAASAATRQAERSSILHWTLAYLSRRPGWTGRAIVVGQAQGPGGKAVPVYVPELGLEARLRPRSPLAPDEGVAVRLVGVDLAALEVSFEEAPPGAN
jgi:exoribonuclease II